MAIYYRADSSEMDDPSQFGEIMLRVQHELLKAGIKLSNFNVDIDSIVENHFANHEVLLEEVISTNTSKRDISVLLDKYITNLNHKGALIVVDPFFFKQTGQSYKNFIIGVLEKQKPIHELKIVTSNEYFNSNVYNEFCKQAITRGIVASPSAIQLSRSDKVHDRYWLTRTGSGFLCGTSLNGLGKKYSLICKLAEDDIKEILSFLNSESLI